METKNSILPSSVSKTSKTFEKDPIVSLKTSKTFEGLIVSCVYGIATISVIGGILLGLATRGLLFKVSGDVVVLTIASTLTTVISILGILLFVGVIKSSRRYVLAYMIIHTTVISVATILQIGFMIQTSVEGTFRKNNLYFLISSCIILIDWVFLAIVVLYYVLIVRTNNSEEEHKNGVEELLTENTTDE